MIWQAVAQTWNFAHTLHGQIEQINFLHKGFAWIIAYLSILPFVRPKQIFFLLQGYFIFLIYTIYKSVLPNSIHLTKKIY